VVSRQGATLIPGIGGNRPLRPRRTDAGPQTQTP
jgi:hypothetical protein